MIHDLNTWGGQDRSTLEIARRLSHQVGVDLITFTLEGEHKKKSQFGSSFGSEVLKGGQWGDARWMPVGLPLGLKRIPAILKFAWYHALSIPYVTTAPTLRGEPIPLIHATGACSLVSDVVQLQFVQAAWKDKMKPLFKTGLYSNYGTRSASPFKSKLLDAYHLGLLEYNIATERLAYKKGKQYIAISHSVKEELSQYFGIQNAVEVIHHGVDPQVFVPATESLKGAQREKLGIETSGFYISFVGAYERKGLQVALEALAVLKNKNWHGLNQLKILAAGSGDTQGFKQMAATLGLEKNLVMLSHQKEVLPVYQACDAFVLPTFYEPFGLVVLEAMACGLAPVVSRTAGASELISDGRSGILLKEVTEPAETAAALVYLFENSQARQSMGNAAREVAALQNWDEVAKKYWKLLGRLL